MAIFFLELGTELSGVPALMLSSKPHPFSGVRDESPLTLAPVSRKNQIPHSGGTEAPGSAASDVSASN